MKVKIKKAPVATPGFHLRNGMSNVFFMLAAGMEPLNIAKAALIIAKKKEKK